MIDSLKNRRETLKHQDLTGKKYGKITVIERAGSLKACCKYCNIAKMDDTVEGFLNRIKLIYEYHIKERNNETNDYKI